MAAKLPIGSRDEVLRPPAGWRKPIPLAVKLQVIVNQQGRAPDGTPLDAIIVGIHFDHRPPLHERVYDPEKDETVPAANDIEFIVALPIPIHREMSAQDVSRMSKTERQRMLEMGFRDRLQRRLPGQKRSCKGTIRSRPFWKKKQM
ncbi:hypothetical protein [Mesorhizobium sp.]|uniref:hypothetical protein n=1 Tax=Mesorhizobium sp. TaxID=1871066 RepID=UPI000FE7CC31|nr:hypothetical protein [Mesorhizobium sp.]RWE64686.1 MAG: hypothetical protein EOS62_28215 [Mesorhizobium sp.]